jgi:hypothetical protein
MPIVYLKTIGWKAAAPRDEHVGIDAADAENADCFQRRLAKRRRIDNQTRDKEQAPGIPWLRAMFPSDAWTRGGTA